MHYDPTSWRSVKKGVPMMAEGAISIRLSAPAALYHLPVGEDKILVGYGTDFNLQWREGVLAFAADVPAVYQVKGRKLVKLAIEDSVTNFDKRPGMSAAEAFVKTALRNFMRSERARNDEMREASLKALAKAKGKEPEPVQADSDPAQPDTTPEPETDKAQ